MYTCMCERVFAVSKYACAEMHVVCARVCTSVYARAHATETNILSIPKDNSELN